MRRYILYLKDRVLGRIPKTQDSKNTALLNAAYNSHTQRVTSLLIWGGQI